MIETERLVKAKPLAGAESWGLWRQDPGPRGVWLRDYEKELIQSNGVAPRGWKFDQNDFWIEEHGMLCFAVGQCIIRLCKYIVPLTVSVEQG